MARTFFFEIRIVVDLKKTSNRYGHCPTMVPIRSRTNGNLDDLRSPQKIAYLALLLSALAILVIYTASPPRSTSHGMPIVSSTAKDVDDARIHQDEVFYGDSAALSFYRCGPLPSSSTTELILLHGAAFSKETWKDCGILEKLCRPVRNLSILALDLPVSADGRRLASALDALVSSGMASGGPATIVTPSASGKAVVSLGEMATDPSANDGGELKRRVKAWIPVASGDGLKASERALRAFPEAGVPVLAIHGDRDSMGRKVTERLKAESGAKGVELKGRHPVYLDSPDEFVNELLQFLEGL